MFAGFVLEEGCLAHFRRVLQVMLVVVWLLMWVKDEAGGGEVVVRRFVNHDT